MKTIIEKEFDAVRYMRQQRNELSEKLAKMSNTEIVAYFKRGELKARVKPSA